MADIGRAPHGPDIATPWTGGPESPATEARHLAEGRPFAWRLSMAAAADALGAAGPLSFREEGHGPDGQRGLVAVDPARLGDVVLARKDVGVAYHLAVVVDDAAQGVTEVIRGVDLFEATFVHRVLQALLELPTPRYRHHPLLLGPDGRRLAKRDHAQTLAELRDGGMRAEALRAELGFG